VITDDKGNVSQDFVNIPVDRSAVPITATPVGTSPSAIDLLAGVGSRIAGSIPIDYTIQTNTVLTATGVGRAVPVLLAGLGFTFASLPSTNKKLHYFVPNSGFVSLQFATSNATSTNAINGYTFGAGYKLQTYLEVMVGYSLSPEMEPSYGFRQAAAQTVTNNPTLPVYQRFSASDILADKPDALDGFPLLLQTASGTAGGPIYPGSILETHYRGGLFVGVAFPFSILKNSSQ
jgi:hypothetical protein